MPTVRIRDAAPRAISQAELLFGREFGHAVLGGGRPHARAGRLRLHAPASADGELATLRGLFADPAFRSDEVVAAAFPDLLIDGELGVAIDRDGRILAETAEVAALIDPTLASVQRLVAGMDEPARCGTPVLHVFDRIAGVYGHFVLDALITIHAFVPALQRGYLSLLLPPYVPAWSRRILQAIGVPQAALLAPGPGAIRCDRAIVVSSTRRWTTYFPDAGRCGAFAQRMRERFRPGGGGRRLFVSRQGEAAHGQRTITNEAAVRTLLEARGFEAIAPGAMSFPEQVRAFSEADVVVGAHGSAFANLIFTPPGATVVDLMPCDWIGYWEPEPPAERWLLNLTTALGLDYDLVLCSSRLVQVLPDEDRSGRQKFSIESEVDLRLLADAVDAARPERGLGKAGGFDVGVTERAMLDGKIDAVRAVQDAALDPLFRMPDRLGTYSAWWGHVPFAGWLMGAARPRSFVELGTYAGVSYSAFCQAALLEGVECRCHAVDTWQGDAHAGEYDNRIYEDFRTFHDAHYADISQIHRCTFDNAAELFEDASIDLLHIDGLHTYDAVRHDFETWLPKLSNRAIVLFHDANERRGDFGVWKFWEEVSDRWPGFLFLHSHGLGVLCVGEDAPAPVKALCAADAAETALIRERLAVIGDRWYAQAHWERAEAELARAREAGPGLDTLQQRVDAMERSTSWRMTAPLRTAASAFPAAARLGRRGAKLLWWTATLQLPSRLADRRRATRRGKPG